MELTNAMAVSAAGMKAQTTRIRVTAENIANAQSVATTPGGNPYQRKMVLFESTRDRDLGIDTVQVKRIDLDKSDFKQAYDPSHPAADENGYVLMPNVNRFIEMQDMKEAQHTYSANLNALQVSREMMRETIGLLSPQ